MTELESLELQLKQLDVQKRQEEINQLRNAGKIRWVTPATLVAIVPLLLWGLTMVKEYTAAILSLNEVAGLKAQRAELEQQKRDLHGEIASLLALKQHYRDEVRARQDAIDKTYMRGKFTSDELVYALSHVKSLPAMPASAIQQLSSNAARLPVDSQRTFNEMLNRAQLTEDIVGYSSNLAAEFQQLFALMAPSDWTKSYQAMPAGMLAGRRLLISEGVGVKSYYDIDLGRLLTSEEASKLQ